MPLLLRLVDKGEVGVFTDFFRVVLFPCTMLHASLFCLNAFVYSIDGLRYIHEYGSNSFISIVLH